MRACMIAYSYYENDNRVRRYAETLVQKGWEVDVIALKSSIHQYPFRLKGVNVYGIQKRTKNESKKISYFIKIFRFLILSALILTKKHLTKRYDLIHIHSVPDFLVFVAIFPKLSGAKIILDIHDIVPELYCAKFGAKLNSFTFKILVFMESVSIAFSDHVIIANHIWHKRITERSVRPDKCSVVLNYPDEEIFGGITKSRTDDTFIMLYPGTLSKHQGIDVAIKALEKIKDKLPKLQFHIYGTGTDENYLKNLVDELGLSDRVKFFNPIPLEDIAKVMANADIGIEPKRREGFSNEAFSTKILEFMILGVPVIASDTEIHKYYLDSSILKYFEAGNVDDLSSCLEYFYINRTDREEYVQNANKFITTMYWSVRSKEYISIINKMLPQYEILDLSYPTNTQ